MRFGRNLAAGIAYTVVSAVVSLAVVPIYLRYLGIEAYGLIGFNATLQGVLQLLDLGLTPTISREVALGFARDDMVKPRALLRTLETVFWVIAAIIGGAIFAGSEPIAGHWLNADRLAPATVATAVALMGATLAARWPAALYGGALTGAHRLTVASVLGTAYIVVANVGVILVLAYWSPTIQAFFVWQAACALGYSLLARTAAWRVLGGSIGARFDMTALRSVARFAIGASALAVTGIVLTQIDKVILSRLLPLADFGFYMLATAVVTALYGFINAVSRVIFPRYTAIIAAGRVDDLVSDYRLLTAILGSVWLPMMTVVAICAHPFLLLWTGNAATAAGAAPLLTVLAMGTAVHGMMYLPYAVQLAAGMTRLPLKINLLLIAIQVPLVIVLTMRFGALGGALAWLVLLLTLLHLGTYLNHRELMRGWGRIWLFKDIYPRIAICIACGVGGVLLMERVVQPIGQLGIGAGVGLAAMAFSLWSSGYRSADIRRLLTT